MLNYYLFYFNRKQAQSSRVDAEKEGVEVPTTVDDYCIKARSQESQFDLADCYDDDSEMADLYDEDESEEEDDSGAF